VRYDFSTATKLLDANQELKRRYGTLTELLAQARTAQELSAKLQEFKHIGPVTARIFIIGTVYRNRVYLGGPRRSSRPE